SVKNATRKGEHYHDYRDESYDQSAEELAPDDAGGGFGDLHEHPHGSFQKSQLHAAADTGAARRCRYLEIGQRCAGGGERGGDRWRQKGSRRAKTCQGGRRETPDPTRPL